MWTDTRPRIKYLYPDGRIAHVIHDHGQRPRFRVDLELRPDDPLWPTAEQRAGTARRFVWLTLAEPAS